MERPTDEERRVLEFLLSSALEREANLIRKGSRIVSDLERIWWKYIGSKTRLTDNGYSSVSILAMRRKQSVRLRAHSASS